MAQELIENIVESLGALMATDDLELASAFFSALSSARASSSRALIPNTRVGSLARYSVAASASAPLRAYLASGTRSPERDALMRSALADAFKLAEGSPSRRNEDVPEATTPEGWERSENGSFTRQTNVGIAEISYSPHMPGGEWTLSLARVPVGFGSTPAENARLLTKIVDFLAGRNGAQRKGNPFRTTRSA